MSNQPVDPRDIIDALIRRLHARGRVRVWSLVITVFGDAIVPRGGRVALSVLQNIVGRLGIEPGALRTAMSRLAADGWVVRDREGRNSFFRLADAGRHAFDLATQRIYAGGAPEWNGGWMVAIATPGEKTGVAEQMAEAGFLRINGGVFLRPRTDDDAAVPRVLDDMLVIHGSSAEHPETLRDLWPGDDIAASYMGVSDAFAPLVAAIEAGAETGPLDAMAARILLIHDWRRVVLRDPGLPAALLPKGWPGEETRLVVRRLYALLAGPSEAWLNENGVSERVEPMRFADIRATTQSSR